MSGLSEVEDWVGREWTFECGEDVNDAFEQIEEDWNPDLRFGLAQVLGNDLPDFMVWLQEQIDDECEDTTETITFTPERDERAEALQDKIIETRFELAQAEEELFEIEAEELEPVREGILETIGRFIRNIFRG